MHYRYNETSVTNSTETAVGAVGFSAQLKETATHKAAAGLCVSTPAHAKWKPFNAQLSDVSVMSSEHELSGM